MYRYTYVYMYIYIYTHIFVCIDTHTCICTTHVCVYTYIRICYIHTYIQATHIRIRTPLLTNSHTAILIIIESQFQAFQRFSSSKLVLKTVDSRFAALNYYGNGSTSTQVMTTTITMA